MYNFNINLSRKIYIELEKLEQSTKKRLKNAMKYRRLLKHPDIVPPIFRYGSTIYRYSIILKRCVRHITNLLRQNGYDASNLYRQPLHELYNTNQNLNNFKNTYYISKRILNLWVEPSLSEEYIANVCDIILNTLNNGIC